MKILAEKLKMDEAQKLKESLKLASFKVVSQQSPPSAESSNTDCFDIYVDDAQFEAANVFLKDYFEQPQADGPATFYYPSGKVYIQTTYKNNQCHGEYFEYYDNGQLAVKGQYINDGCEGTFEYFDLQGKLSCREHYSADKLNGECVWFYAQGTPCVKTVFKDDELIEDFQLFDETGAPLATYGYQDDNLVQIEYYSSKKHTIELEYFEDAQSLQLSIDGQRLFPRDSSEDFSQLKNMDQFGTCQKDVKLNVDEREEEPVISNQAPEPDPAVMPTHSAPSSGYLQSVLFAFGLLVITLAIFLAVRRFK